MTATATSPSGDTSEFSGAITVAAAPPNDYFADAPAISGGTASVSGTNVNATREPGEPDHVPTDAASVGENSVWYRWTAPASGQTTLDTCTKDFDTVLGVYTGGTLGSLTQEASNDDTPGCGTFNNGSKVTFNAQAGTTYRIAVSGYHSSSEGTFTLKLNGSPKVTPPAQSLLRNSTLGLSQIPTRLAWSATDEDGVAGYELQRSKDGGAYINVSLPTATRTNITPSLEPGSTYRFRVRAQDNTGNWSAWKYGPTFKVDPRQENGVGVSYPSGAWTIQNLASAYGGAVKYSTEKGAKAKVSFKGRNVAWVAPKRPNRGKAEVYLDGKKVATVDLYSATALSRKVIYAANNLNPSVTHTLIVKVMGTSGRPRVDVDAFVVVR